ncbi:hypothetical protein [Dactylosporangium sp. CA-092794]|uniref:hypothetical protein n=1 Tax=Dactylosporangium sp. CA-092794 TaxID=3239929 RepID=UPI003D942BE7
MEDGSIDRRVWGLAAAGAVLLDLLLGWRQLWLQPHLDAHDLPRWQTGLLQVAAIAALWIAIGIPTALAPGPERQPQGFLVRPGKFVAPAAARIRVSVTMVALALWGLVPFLVESIGRYLPQWSPWVAIAAGAVLASAATAVAARIWARKVLLTPETLIVRGTIEPEVALPWDTATPEAVAARPAWRGVNAEFLARAIEHYREHPEHRRAIGTPEEHARLTALLRRPKRTPDAVAE